MVNAMKTSMTGSRRKPSLRRFAILGLSFIFLLMGMGGVFFVVRFLQPNADETPAGRPSVLERNLAETLGHVGLAKSWAEKVQLREYMWQVDEILDKYNATLTSVSIWCPTPAAMRK
jgi:hypothetical protein